MNPKPIECPNCSKRYARTIAPAMYVECKSCQYRFFVRFSDELSLIEWITFVVDEISTIDRFVSRGGLNAYSKKTAQVAKRIFEIRKLNQETFEVQSELTETVNKWKEALQDQNELDELNTHLEDQNEQLDIQNDELGEQLLLLNENKLSLQAELNAIFEELQASQETNREHRRFLKDGVLAEQVKTWARYAPWEDIDQYITTGGAANYPQSLIDKLVEIYTLRRWEEEDKIRAVERARQMQLRAEMLERAEKTKFNDLQNKLASCTKDDLLQLTPGEFERFVAEVFQAMGFEARATGGTMDGGVDVQVMLGDELYAIAQCKRFTDTSISSAQIRDFAGAFISSTAKRAFFFTTSDFTTPALDTARRFSGLELYDLPKLQSFVSSAARKLEQKSKINQF